MSEDKRRKTRKPGAAPSEAADRAGLGESLSRVAGQAQTFGESLASAGRQAEAAMQGVSRQAQTAGERLEKAFGAQRAADGGAFHAERGALALPGKAQSSAGGGAAAEPRAHVTANITVNPPPGANPREIARLVIDELARLKIRGHG